jgi:tRNA 2-thiocytidine biosynthesis protein TtcA
MAAFVLPPKRIRRAVGQALVDFQMLRDGDRVLLGLSGGKDSLSLLHILRHVQRVAPVRFEFGAVTIDPMTPEYDPGPLKPYLAGLGVDYHRVREPLVELAQRHMHGDSYCAFCARMRRGLMYRTARRAGYNVVALGQHLDDLAESFLMSAFHGGRLGTMKAHYRNDLGDIRVLRPLVYIRERQLQAFAREAALPVIPDNCPACFSQPTERARIKALLADEEHQHPQLFKSLVQTLKPLMAVGQPEHDAYDDDDGGGIRDIA